MSDNPDENNNNNSDPVRLAQTEAIKWRQKYNDLKDTHDELTKAHDELKTNHDKLSETHAAASKKLTEYESVEARKAALGKLLESKEVRGKMAVDADKAMKYLKLKAYNPDTLEADVREAVEFVGEKIKPNQSSLNPRGAGALPDNSNSDRTAPAKTDPIALAVGVKLGV